METKCIENNIKILKWPERSTNLIVIENGNLWIEKHYTITA